MCGIIGLFDLTGSRRPWPEDRFARMVGALHHRGPDGRGAYHAPGVALGQTRLAVIDLSEDARQPMEYAGGRYAITYNGEIYNYRELRSELKAKGHVFRSASDTEVVLAAWAEWGEEALKRLEGMFAFVIYDRDRHELYAARDRIGIKPLYYYSTPEHFGFTSEPLALFGPILPVPEFNLEDLDAYFTFNYLAAPRSGLKGLQQLKPGHVLKISNGVVTDHEYWTWEFSSEKNQWQDRYVDEFEDVLQQSIQRQLVADVPVGVFLSGGLDSYTVANYARSMADHNFTSYTLGFQSQAFDERPAAQDYASHLQLPNQSAVFSWGEDVVRDTLSDMRELLADASCFPMHQLAKLARKDSVVVLSGDGGDELLAGYDTYKAGHVTPMVRALPAPLRRAAMGLSSFLPYDSSRYGKRMVVQRLLLSAEEGRGRDHATFRRIFTDVVKRKLYAYDFFDAVKDADPVHDYASLVNDPPQGLSYLTARQRADLIFHMPSILAKVDRMSMAHGLEVRVALLDERMVDFCLRLPDVAKRYRGKSKRVLREAVSHKIPPAALKRPKAGFLPPVDQWFRLDQTMRNVFGDYLSEARQHLNILDWQAVENLWDDHRIGKVDAGFTLLGILQFINWSMQLKQTSSMARNFES